MRKLSIALVLIATVSLLQFCSSSKKAAVAPVAAVTYEANVKPVIQASCGPCHIAGKGNKKSLDNYTDASSSADDMIARIQKNPDEHGFMPMRNPKLSEAAITAFVEWKKTGLKEK